ncbi:MAG: ATP-grasp domain-containing protein [Ruminococcus sp.]|nr:ATP-grasp domain-containing protein [Ruminococcus sp.]
MKKAKKIMMLGGNFFQMTAIKRAKELGYYVISVDYLPDNPGHAYSDAYYNVSTIDKEAVLDLAMQLKIDGILSYASDVSAPTAAYVAEQLNLPTNPFESVMTLTHKQLFRKFMRDNQLSMIEGECFDDRNAAKEYFYKMSLPVMVKPVDASGSKGVVKVQRREDFDSAYEHAMSYSISQKVIVEQFIQKKGYQIDGDGFIKDGKIVFWGVMDQHNNMIRNPHAPIGLSTPSIQSEIYQEKARNLVQKIFDKLEMKFGAFNFEYIIGEDDEIYLLEIGPRNGGNFIPDTLKYAQGVDMIEASIKACVGDEYTDALRIKKKAIASSYVIHSMTEGRFKELRIQDELKQRIIKQELFVQEGDWVNAFKNGGNSLGAMVIAFDDIEQMSCMMDQMWEYVRVIVE